eukprot:845493-Prorocentrum_minimum.AAC.1
MPFPLTRLDSPLRQVNAANNEKDRKVREMKEVMEVLQTSFRPPPMPPSDPLRCPIRAPSDPRRFVWDLD